MGLIERWFDDAKSVIVEPSSFFAEADRDGFGYPLKFAVISLVIAGVLSSISSLLWGSVFGSASFAIANALGSLIGTVIGGVIGLFIGAALIHIFVILFGGEGYGRTFAVLAYATALSPLGALLGFIPILGALAGIVVGLYGLYVEVKGVEIFHGLTTGRAALAVILPIVIIIGLVFLLFLTVGLAMLAAFAGAGAA